MFWPTVNSYKRLVDGFWAPTKPTWGVDNRTASFRVIPGLAQVDAARDPLPGRRHQPVPRDGRVPRRRADGIEKGLKLTAKPIDRHATQGAENIPRAPRTLIETTRIFSESDVARDWFGDDFVDHFAATREWEWRQWLDARHRLGAEALLRDHLRRHGHRPLQLPDHDPLRRRRAQARRRAPDAARASSARSSSPTRARGAAAARASSWPHLAGPRRRRSSRASAATRCASQVDRRRRGVPAHDADAVIGLGGGAALDVAKAVALMARAPGRPVRVRGDHPQARPIDQRAALLRRAAHHRRHRQRGRPLARDLRRRRRT